MALFKKKLAFIRRCLDIKSKGSCQMIGVYSLVCSLVGIYFLMFCVLGKWSPRIIQPYLDNGTYGTIHSFCIYWVIALMFNIYGSLLMAIGVSINTTMYVWPFFFTFGAVMAFQFGFSVWIMLTFPTQVAQITVAAGMLIWFMYNLYLTLLVFLHMKKMKRRAPPISKSSQRPVYGIGFANPSFNI